MILGDYCYSLVKLKVENPSITGLPTKYGYASRLVCQSVNEELLAEAAVVAKQNRN